MRRVRILKKSAMSGSLDLTLIRACAGGKFCPKFVDERRVIKGIAMQVSVPRLGPLINWFWSLFDRDKPAEPPKPRSKGRVRSVDYVEGNYTSVKQLLDDLEYWSGMVSKFKTSATDADRLVKTLGVYVPGRIEYVNRCEIPEGKAPLYFATTFHSGVLREEFDRAPEDYVTTMVYGVRQKHKNCAEFIAKPKHGWFYDIYIGYYLDGKWRMTNTFAELRDGGFHLLRFRQEEQKAIMTKKGRQSYMHTVWKKRTLLVSDRPTSEAETIDYITMAFNLYLRRGASTEVHATSNGTRLVFSVPEHRWKDFFKDRVTAKAADGKRKRIFHHVAAHRRANGSLVPMHTRGETEFYWGDHRIRIVEQKKGRAYATEIDLSCESSDDDFLSAGQLGPSQAASMILRHQLKRLHQPRKKTAA